MIKQEAAAEQIDQAIKLWREGQFASALTLAGASEGAMPPPADATLFHVLRDLVMEAVGVSEKEAVAKYVNQARDWLKHDSPDERMEISAFDAFLMIIRAYTKFIMVYGEDAQTETMFLFVEENRKSVKRFSQPMTELIVQLLRDWRGKSAAKHVRQPHCKGGS